MREAYRQFRIDRVVSVRLTDIDQKERASLQELKEMKEKHRASFTLQKVVIRVEKNIALYLQERRHYYGFVSETIKDNYVEMTFLSQSPDQGFARWFIMFADYAEVIEPLSVKESVKKILERISKKITL